MVYFLFCLQDFNWRTSFNENGTIFEHIERTMKNDLEFQFNLKHHLEEISNSDERNKTKKKSMKTFIV